MQHAAKTVNSHSVPTLGTSLRFVLLVIGSLVCLSPRVASTQLAPEFQNVQHHYWDHLYCRRIERQAVTHRYVEFTGNYCGWCRTGRLGYLPSLAESTGGIALQSATPLLLFVERRDGWRQFVSRFHRRLLQSVLQHR